MSIYHPSALALWATLALAASACKYSAPPPRAYVIHGVAHSTPISLLAAVPAVCERTTMGCVDAYRVAVDNTAKLYIEYHGYGIIESALINAELRTRRTSTVTSDAQTTVDESVVGKTWLDLQPEERRTLLADIGAQGVLQAVVGLGVPHGMAGQRTVTVRLVVTRLADDALVWQSQCQVETGDYHSEDQAVFLATRCALEASTLW
jgi:hypothetical protein